MTTYCSLSSSTLQKPLIKSTVLRNLSDRPFALHQATFGLAVCIALECFKTHLNQVSILKFFMNVDT